MPILYTKDTLIYFKNDTDQKYKDQVISPNIRPQFVKSLIKKKICICQRPINTSKLEQELKLTQLEDYSEHEQVLIELKTHLNTFQKI